MLIAVPFIMARVYDVEIDWGGFLAGFAKVVTNADSLTNAAFSFFNKFSTIVY